MNVSHAVSLAWQLAAQETVAGGKDEIGPAQMFCGMTKVPEILNGPNVVPELLTQSNAEAARAEAAEALGPLSEQGVELVGFRRSLRARVGMGSHRHGPSAKVGRSPVLKSLFDRAELLSGPQPGGVLALRHLLAAMLEDRNLLLTHALTEQHIDVEAILARLRDPAIHPRPSKAEQLREPGNTPYLDKYGRDLTASARKGILGPIVGRRIEVLQVMETLVRRTKSNPVLVGEAGVGKTAVAESLAIRIAALDCVEPLRDCRVIELSLSTLLAGAVHAGERERRIEAVVHECRENGRIILFLDELHTLIKAGGVGGAVDPADIFKPALGRGEIRCIGATTHDEYARYVEADAALERRFTKVVVTEPCREATLEILRGLRRSLEVHHGATIPDETMIAAVDLAMQFDTTHQLPDKAIDLLDLAAARTRLPSLSLAATSDAQAAIPLVVDRETVIAALAGKLGIPTGLISRSAQAPQLHGLVAFLKSKILGQDDAIERIAHRLQLSQAQLRARRGPLGVFLFVGATGVGKTAMAQSLSDYLFADTHALTRIDMSEYQEEHSVSKLVGAPPGYVGHEAEGRLTGALRARPHCVVLLDEIDKAHPKVFDLFLQLFDEGRLTDSKGRTADARHAIFILTGNFGVQQRHAIGFIANADEADVDKELRRRFRPEFLNRIDERIEFASLTAAHIAALIDQAVGEITESVATSHAVELQVLPGALALLAQRGFSRDYGVRHLGRTIETLLEAPLLDVLAGGAVTKRLCVDVADAALAFRWVQP